MQADENPSRLISDFYLVVPFRLDYLYERIFYVLNAEELAFNANLVPILYSADTHTFEVAYRLNKAHPE